MANSDTFAWVIGILAICLALIGFMLPEQTSITSFPYGNLTDVPQTFPYSNLTGVPSFLTFTYKIMPYDTNTTSNILVAVPEMTFTVLANTKYMIEGFFNVKSSSTADSASFVLNGTATINRLTTLVNLPFNSITARTFKSGTGYLNPNQGGSNFPNANIVYLATIIAYLEVSNTGGIITLCWRLAGGAGATASLMSNSFVRISIIN